MLEHQLSGYRGEDAGSDEEHIHQRDPSSNPNETTIRMFQGHIRLRSATARQFHTLPRSLH
jgi:hypothetical protein